MNGRRPRRCRVIAVRASRGSSDAPHGDPIVTDAPPPLHERRALRPIRDRRAEQAPAKKPLPCAGDPGITRPARRVFTSALGMATSVSGRHRRVNGMELDPHYGSVVVARWESFSGKEAVCLG